MALLAICLAGGLLLAMPVAPSYSSFEEGAPAAILEGGGPGAWDEHVREKVQVIEEDGTFKMWYVGHSTLGERTSKVGYATSEDGWHWNKYPGNPILNRNTQDQDISVVRVSRSIYHMYVEVNDSYVELFYSFDGIDWRQHPNSPVKPLAASPVVWMDGDAWFMLYERMVKEPTYSIHLAISSDGLTWTDHPQNPVLVEDTDVVPDSIVKAGSVHHLYYHQKARDQDAWPTMHAVSTNLTTWLNREELMHEYSSAYIMRREQGEIWSYLWKLGGDQKYYLRYGQETDLLTRWCYDALR